MAESLWTLLRDPAHWEFELLLLLVVDGLLGAVLWPLVRRRLSKARAHHRDDHAELDALRRRIEALEQRPLPQPNCSQTPPPADLLKGAFPMEIGPRTAVAAAWRPTSMPTHYIGGMNRIVSEG